LEDIVLEMCFSEEDSNSNKYFITLVDVFEDGLMNRLNPIAKVAILFTIVFLFVRKKKYL
jgi:hypothetical protein